MGWWKRSATWPSLARPTAFWRLVRASARLPWRCCSVPARWPPSRWTPTFPPCWRKPAPNGKAASRLSRAMPWLFSLPRFPSPRTSWCRTCPMRWPPPSSLISSSATKACRAKPLWCRPKWPTACAPRWAPRTTAPIRLSWACWPNTMAASPFRRATSSRRRA